MAENQENWEDQLRRMINEGRAHQSVNTESRLDYPDYPVVRLPPATTPSHPHYAAAAPGHSVYTRHFTPQNSVPTPPQIASHDQIQNAYDSRLRHSMPNQDGFQHHQPREPIDPNAFEGRGRGRGRGQGYTNHFGSSRGLYNPTAHLRNQMLTINADRHAKQARYLESVASKEIPSVEMSQDERSEKNAFRDAVATIIDEICAASPDRLSKVSLRCFGSFQSGFASKGSDMDLVIVSQDGSAAACFALDEHDLPRTLEKRMLKEGYGARLLTRTRVPILKLCEKPTEVLLQKLREERDKWDKLPEQEKYPHLFPDVAKPADPATSQPDNSGMSATVLSGETGVAALDSKLHDLRLGVTPISEHPNSNMKPTAACNEDRSKSSDVNTSNGPDKPKHDREWTRERRPGPLNFPSEGVGIQSDINFFNPLGLHNTQLLRCYSLCDARVRPMVLFVKSWAKRRKINSSYSGTLSSYGYVLMVLHYLVNVVQPPVIPNLQAPWRPGPEFAAAGATAVEVDGWMVDFWRNEDEILDAVRKGKMTPNVQSLGSLLAGFFNYYSSQGDHPVFHWMQQCLSLRTIGGLLTKVEKGWVKAVTEEGEGKRVQHRYLFCIEDPFELNHNVARTVTHNGIIAIRDEFRRARRVLLSRSNDYDPYTGGIPAQVDLFAPAIEEEERTGAPRRDDTTNNTFDGNGSRAQRGGRPSGQRGDRGGHIVGHPNNTNLQKSQNPPPTAMQTRYEDAFPSLSKRTAATTHRPARGGKSTGPQRSNGIDDPKFGEVSDDRATARLDEARRKKMEQHAEKTALDAAESVLDGMD